MKMMKAILAEDRHLLWRTNTYNYSRFFYVCLWLFFTLTVMQCTSTLRNDLNNVGSPRLSGPQLTIILAIVLLALIKISCPQRNTTYLYFYNENIRESDYQHVFFQTQLSQYLRTCCRQIIRLQGGGQSKDSVHPLTNEGFNFCNLPRDFFLTCVTRYQQQQRGGEDYWKQKGEIGEEVIFMKLKEIEQVEIFPPTTYFFHFHNSRKISPPKKSPRP